MLKKYYSDRYSYSTTERKQTNYNVESTAPCNVTFKSREELGMGAPDGSIEKLRELLMQGDGDPMLEKQMELFSEVMRILVPLSQQATR